MMILQGTGISSGIAIGTLCFSEQKEPEIVERKITDTTAECARFEACRVQASEELGQLAIDVSEKVGAENAVLFEVHQMMLEDLDYVEAITACIEEYQVCAEYAVHQVAEQFAQMFAQMDDEYMQARAIDVKDISQRVIRLLLGIAHTQDAVNGPSVLFGEDFTPSQTAQFDRANVLGLITRLGSKNSHTAIFARTLGIPAVIGLAQDIPEGFAGGIVILDGQTGEVILAPDETTLAEKSAQKELLSREKERLLRLKGKETKTMSGKEVKLMANIGSPADLQAVLDNDAEGVGLFRSEFLYLESAVYPTEEEQYQAYREVAQKMQGKPVVIRTLDIGADKQAAYFELPQEENPAMGLRALRICLTRPEVFKTQLKALLRAACDGNIHIMLPMVASLWEIQKAKEIIAEAKEELASAKVPFAENVPVGIMIETPAAAIMSDMFAKEVDFFSIGTNDLTQYTLAVDRQNEAIEPFCDIYHPALLRLIEMVAKNAHEQGIWVGICGELGADMRLTEFFCAAGIDELSVSPTAVLPLREKICDLA